MELYDTSCAASNDDVPPSTLGWLLRRVGDVRKEAVEDSPAHHSQMECNNLVDHQMLDLSSTQQPSLPLVMSFKDLTYSVTIQQKWDFKSLVSWRRATMDALEDIETPQVGRSSSATTKTILNNVSGEARDGEILAVLGASGSGKSTLIDALASRIAKGSLKGAITLNGEVIPSRLMRVISAYVRQDDLLFPMLTVEETLMFAAEFRLSRSLPQSKKKLRVRALIDQLGLMDAAKTMIGDEGHRGVSGGERRRVSIGIDIIHDPIILFLDEPTSGLDSTSALMLIKVLKRIAESGSIVMVSIHQPSFRILNLLDRLIFLSRGQTVFSGSPASLPRYFAEFGQPIPEHENQTEFALDLIRELEGSANGIRGLVEFNRLQQAKLAQPDPRARPDACPYQSSLKEAISASISRGKLVSGARNGSSPASVVPTFANPFWVEMSILSKRAVTNSQRMPELFGIRLVTLLVTGFVLATMFWRLDNSPKGVQERIGFLAFAVSTTTYTCADALPVFLRERYIFMRETSYNAYRRSSYVLSDALLALPSLLLLSPIFAATTFWAVGLDGGLDNFVFYCLTIFVSLLAGNSFVTFLAGVVPHVMLGYTILVAILAMYLLFSGFFISRDRIPTYWIWLHYVSLVKYPYEAVLRNEFENPTKCFVRGVQLFDNSPLRGVTEALKETLLKKMSEPLGTGITNSTCLMTGPDVLKQQGITDLTKWTCLWITLAWAIFFRFLFYFSLQLGSKNKRR